MVWWVQEGSGIKQQSAAASWLCERQQNNYFVAIGEAGSADFLARTERNKMTYVLLRSWNLDARAGRDRFG